MKKQPIKDDKVEFKGPVEDPEIPDRTSRGGGGWVGSAWFSRVSYRSWHIASDRLEYQNFRIVRNKDTKKKS